MSRGLDEPMAIVVSPDRSVLTWRRPPWAPSHRRPRSHPGHGARSRRSAPIRTSVRSVAASPAAAGAGRAAGQRPRDPSALALAPDGAGLTRRARTASPAASGPRAQHADRRADAAGEPVPLRAGRRPHARLHRLHDGPEHPEPYRACASRPTAFAVRRLVRTVRSPRAPASAIRPRQPGRVRRDRRTAACVTRTGSPRREADVPGGRRPAHPTSVAVSPDGRHVYVGAEESNAVTAYARNAATSGLAPLADHPSTAAWSVPGRLAERRGSRPSAAARRPLTSPRRSSSARTARRSTSAAQPRRDPPARAAADLLASSVSVVAGIAGAVPLPCTDANGDTLLRSIATRPPRARSAPSTRPRPRSPTPQQHVQRRRLVGFTASDGVLSAAPATATVTVSPAPPPPIPPTAFSLTRATAQGVVWRRSRLIAGVVVTGSVRRPRPRASACAASARGRCGERRPGLPHRARLHVRGGTFTRRIPLSGGAASSRAASRSRSAPRSAGSWCRPRPRASSAPPSSAPRATAAR